MSDPVSALNLARFEGLATVEETGLMGMIALRGDLKAAVLKKAATAASGGAPMPAPLTISASETGAIAWMSPDEVLVMCPHQAAAERTAALVRALADSHALAANVSDARAVFRIAGPGAREALAKLCPLDLSPAAFPPGTFRRTRAAQIPVALWAEGDTAIRLICFRSVADYAFGILKAAAKRGAEVGYF